MMLHNRIFGLTPLMSGLHTGKTSQKTVSRVNELTSREGAVLQGDKPSVYTSASW